MKKHTIEPKDQEKFSKFEKLILSKYDLHEILYFGYDFNFEGGYAIQALFYNCDNEPLLEYSDLEHYLCTECKDSSDYIALFLLDNIGENKESIVFTNEKLLKFIVHTICNKFILNVVVLSTEFNKLQELINEKITA